MKAGAPSIEMPPTLLPCALIIPAVPWPMLITVPDFLPHDSGVPMTCGMTAHDAGFRPAMAFLTAFLYFCASYVTPAHMTEFSGFTPITFRARRATIA